MQLQGEQRMKKLTHSIIILLFICLLLSSCVERGHNMELVDQNTILYKECEKKYSHERIEKLVDKRLDLKELGRCLGIEHYKYSNENYYIVVKSDGGFIIIWFDANMCYLSTSNILFSDDIYYDSISLINIGDDLADVSVADKTGQFDFLYHSWSMYPKISYHYFENGECFVFMYDSEYKVKSIWTFTF